MMLPTPAALGRLGSTLRPFASVRACAWRCSTACPECALPAPRRELGGGMYAVGAACELCSAVSLLLLPLPLLAPASPKKVDHAL